MKRHLPFALTTFRLLLGPLALGCASTGQPRWIFLPILVAGALSDIFDGVLARRFGIATPALRRYDSSTDLIYYLFILGALWRFCAPVVSANWPAVALLLAAELATLLTCLLKFGKYPATHSWMAKTYSLCLLGGLTALLCFNAANWAILGLTLISLATHGEIIAMHLIARRQPVDVRSVFQLIRQQRQSSQTAP